MPRHALIALPLLLAACSGERGGTPTAATQDRLATVLGDRQPGPPQRCISNLGLSGPEIVGGTLVYRDGPNRLYRNDLGNDCPGLDRDTILVFRNLTGTQLCRNDTFTMIDRAGGFPRGGLCNLGDFVPYERPARP